MLKVTFLYHSAFLVELSHCSLLFDWYGGAIPAFDRHKPLYVFCQSSSWGPLFPGDFFPFWEWTMSGMYWPIAFACPPNGKQPWVLRRRMYFGCLQGGHSRWKNCGLRPFVPQMPALRFSLRRREKPYSTQGICNGGIGKRNRKHWNDEMEREFKKEGAKLMGRKNRCGFPGFGSPSGVVLLVGI